MPIVRIEDVEFSNLSFPEAVVRIRRLLGGSRPAHVILANASTLNHAHRDRSYRTILQRADLVLRDGVGVELASAVAGSRLRYNFVGTDFIPDLLVLLQDMGLRVFLYGAAAGVARDAARRLVEQASEIRITGIVDGYGDERRVLERINRARPDLLLVALGNPLQEKWIAAHLDSLDCRVAVGVGALFDYLAERVKRAPLWVRALRSEWVYRLALEPGRLAGRYVFGNPAFMYRIAAGAWQARVQPGTQPTEKA